MCWTFCKASSKKNRNTNVKVIIKTIKRLIYQSILSLLIPAALATFTGHTDELFFCNANVYRSTDTIERTNINTDYVQSMSLEQQSSKMNRCKPADEVQDKEEEAGAMGDNM